MIIFRGARHGLRATGKLARIARQEKMLLTQPQYEGYTHAKKLKQQKAERIDQMTIEEDIPVVQKRKKKRKRCSENGIQVESKSSLSQKTLKSKNNGDASKDKNVKNGRNSEEPMTVCCDVLIDNNLPKSKTKKNRQNENKNTEVLETIEPHGEVSKNKKNKKKVKAEHMDCC